MDLNVKIEDKEAFKKMREKFCPDCPFFQYYIITEKMRGSINKELEPRKGKLIKKPKKKIKKPIKVIFKPQKKYVSKKIINDLLDVCKKLDKQKKQINWETIAKAQGKDPFKMTKPERKRLASQLMSLSMRGKIKKIKEEEKKGRFYTQYKLVKK